MELVYSELKSLKSTKGQGVRVDAYWQEYLMPGLIKVSRFAYRFDESPDVMWVMTEGDKSQTIRKAIETIDSEFAMLEELESEGAFNED